MTDIFISYANEDRERARALAAAFEKQGWSVFWDRTIPTGKTWRQVIGKALREAGCVVVLWSESSIESDWVQEEADDGRERHVLIPVLIDDVLPPIGFRSFQTEDLSGWDGAETSRSYRRLITDIAAVLGPSPAAKKQRTEAQAERKAKEDAAREKTEQAEARKKAEAEASRQAEEEEAQKKTEAEAERKVKEEAAREKFKDVNPPAGGFAAHRPQVKRSKVKWLVAATVLVFMVVGIGMSLYQRGIEQDRIATEQEADRRAQEADLSLSPGPDFEAFRAKVDEYNRKAKAKIDRFGQ